MSAITGRRLATMLAVGAVTGAAVLAGASGASAADTDQGDCGQVENIVVNCGFETFGFPPPGWSTDANVKVQSLSGVDPHSGTTWYGTESKPDTVTTLSQLLTVAPDTTYSVSWFSKTDGPLTPTSSTPLTASVTNAETAQGSVGTVSLLTSTELPPTTWTPYSATFTTPHTIDTPPSLEFTVGATTLGPGEDFFFVGFDDVSVVATAAPPATTGGTTATPMDYTCTAAPFPDVATSSPFCADINYLTRNKITAGYPDGDFRPAATVTRQAMAAFLYRYANPGNTAAACTSKPFTDVAVSSPFCADIAALKASGAITGYADGGFHPTAAVSRQATSTFLYRLANPGGTAPACTSAAFNDVPASSQFCGDINYLVTEKVTTGYSDGGFHPTTAVSRQAMAAFLHRLNTATR